MGLVVLALVGSGCASSPPSPNGLPLFELREEGYDVMPEGFVPTGILVASKDRIIVWSSPRRGALLRSGSAWVPLDLPSYAVGACFLEGGRSHILDAAGTLSTFNFHGVLEARSNLFKADSLVSARCSEGSWYVMTRTGTLLGDLSQTLTRPELLRESWPELPGARPSEIILSGAEDGSLLLTSSVQPFSIIRFSTETKRAMSFSPLLELDIPEELRTEEGTWRSLGTIPISSSAVYLRTLVDGQSDNRMLALYDTCGKVVRTVAIRAPIGLVAAEADYVYAMRHTGRIELHRAYRVGEVPVGPEGARRGDLLQSQ